MPFLFFSRSHRLEPRRWSDVEKQRALVGHFTTRAGLTRGDETPLYLLIRLLNMKLSLRIFR